MPQVSEITVLDGNGVSRDVATLTAIAALLGEVVASPTANTVLARLKTIGDKDFATQTTLAAVLAAIAALPQTNVLAAGENHIGEVGSRTLIVPVTLSLDTAQYAPGDVMATTQQVDAALRITNGTGVLQSVQVFDADDQTGYDFDLYIHRTSTSIGSENSPISISAANAIAAEMKKVEFLSADHMTDLVNCKLYQRDNLGIPLRAVSGTDDLYISTVLRSGTPTHSAAGVTVVLGLLLD